MEIEMEIIRLLKVYVHTPVTSNERPAHFPPYIFHCGVHSYAIATDLIVTSQVMVS